MGDCSGGKYLCMWTLKHLLDLRPVVVEMHPVISSWEVKEGRVSVPLKFNLLWKKSLEQLTARDMELHGVSVVYLHTWNLLWGGRFEFKRLVLANFCCRIPKLNFSLQLADRQFLPVRGWIWQWCFLIEDSCWKERRLLYYQWLKDVDYLSRTCRGFLCDGKYRSCLSKLLKNNVIFNDRWWYVILWILY